MTKKQPWNIWRIKNRPLRALFTLLAMTPILAASIAFVALVSACAGIGEGASYAWYVFRRNSDVKKMWGGYWRAVTLREAP